MTDAEILELADRFFAAIERGDIDAVRAMYADDAVVWHNNDQYEQPKEQNLRVLAWIVRNVEPRHYDDVRREVVAGGFVQQHVLRGQSANGPLEVPAMMRVWTAGGRITRIDEYLDPAQAALLTT